MIYIEAIEMASDLRYGMNVRRIFHFDKPDDRVRSSACNRVDLSLQRRDAETLRILFSDPFLDCITGIP
ncbi:hypothetical protein VR45_36945 [Streptomyces sp. NRRL S-495]|nr:hypothetical protein VR45_36945 [Streptomyces sp. NRRL S-495]